MYNIKYVGNQYIKKFMASNTSERNIVLKNLFILPFKMNYEQTNYWAIVLNIAQLDSTEKMGL